MSIFDNLIEGLGQMIVPRRKPPTISPVPEELLSPEEMTAQEESALTDLAKTLARSDYWAHRQDAIRKYKAREYYKGFHYIPYGDEFRGFPEVSADPSLGPRFIENGSGDDTTFTFNFFQAYGKALIAVLGGRVPGVRFYPRDTNNQDDIATANAANDIWDHFRRINRMSVKQKQMLLHGWTDGSCGILIQNVKDAARFGTHKVPITQEVPQVIDPGIPDHNQCPACGAQGPPDAAQCQCGQWFGPHTFVPGVPPTTAMVEETIGYNEVPNQEVTMEVVGGIEIRAIPLDARSFHEYLALAWATELDLAYVKAMHRDLPPEKLSQIRAGSGITDLDSQGRVDRMRSKSRTAGGQTTGPYQSAYLDEDSRVTYTRIWIRPAAFYKIKQDDIRDGLLARFPKGCRVNLAGTTLCSVTNESMDDRWYNWFPNPGDGQVRESMGDILLDVQDALNDLYNLSLDQLRHSLPITFVDEKCVSMEAIEQNRERGGTLWPANRVDQQALSNNFHTTSPASVSPQVTEMISQLAGFVSQFLTGANPALLGQGSSDLKTASGYKMALGQSLGRMSIPWQSLKEGNVAIANLVIKCFVEANQQDGAVISKFANNSLITRRLSPDDLKGQVVAYPEGDEEYPQDPSDVRDVLLGWINSPNPGLQQASMDPDNFDFIRTYLGVAGFNLPGQKQRAKQLREIQELLKGEPVPPPIDPVTGQPALDQMTGMPMQPQPSIPIDPVFDDNQAEFLAVQHWLWSEEAKQLQGTPGYQNVWLHGMAHFQQTMMGMPMQGAPPPADGAPSGSGPALDIPPAPGLGDPPPELTEPQGPPQAPQELS